MAISVNWSTKIITVPQADLTLVSGTLYELDTDAFRLALKALEDDEIGIVFPDTHRHTTEIAVAGVTYARFVEIINGYQVMFEDLGHPGYTIRMAGSNNNIFEAGVIILNHNSVIGQNSAGLIVVTTGSGLSAEEQAKLDDLHKIQGLDAGSPMTVTPTTRTAGAIDQEITGDGENTTTVTRQ